MTSDAVPTAPQQTTRRAPRWMTALLVISLALNLLVVGIVLGSAWAVRRGGYWDAPMFFERTHRFMRGLPPERRAQIRALFAEHKPRLEPHWREVRKARVEIGALIERGYTPEQFEAALDDLAAKELRARQAAKPMIASMLSTLAPRERLHFLAVYMPYLNEMQGRPSGGESTP